MKDQDLGYGEDVLEATVFGDDVPALKMAGLDEARALYGPEAMLAIEDVRHIRTSAFGRSEGRGAFCATVTVRCVSGEQ